MEHLYQDVTMVNCTVVFGMVHLYHGNQLHQGTIIPTQKPWYITPWYNLPRFHQGKMCHGGLGWYICTTVISCTMVYHGTVVPPQKPWYILPWYISPRYCLWLIVHCFLGLYICTMGNHDTSVPPHKTIVHFTRVFPMSNVPQFFGW
jgi:hypothetical protein